MLDFLKTEPKKLSKQLGMLEGGRRLRNHELGVPLKHELDIPDLNLAQAAFVQKHHACIGAAENLRKALEKQEELERTMYTPEKLREMGLWEAIEDDGKGGAQWKGTKAGRERGLRERGWASINFVTGRRKMG